MARSTPIIAKRKTKSNIVVNVPMLPERERERREYVYGTILRK